MYSEAKKLHIIETVLKINSDAVLMEIEALIEKTLKPQKAKKQKSAHDFLGLISKEDTLLMTTAIEKGCEQINPDDWK